MNQRPGLNEAEILALAERKKEFRVSKYLYRDDNLRKKVRRMVREGKLRLKYVDKRGLYFEIPFDRRGINPDINWL